MSGIKTKNSLLCSHLREKKESLFLNVPLFLHNNEKV